MFSDIMRIYNVRVSEFNSQENKNGETPIIGLRFSSTEVGVLRFALLCIARR